MTRQASAGDSQPHTPQLGAIQPGSGERSGGKQGGCDQNIHEGAGKRDPKLLTRLRTPFEPRDTPDRVHHDFNRSDAVPPCYAGMSKLVKQHGREQGADVDCIEHG